MSFSRLLRDFARIFFPSVLALVAFIALGGFIAFDIMKPQYGVFPPLENDLFWFIAIVIASVLGIFLVHIARGGIFSEAVKQPFYRLRREPLWTVLAAATVFLLLWLVMFLLKPLGTRITNHFGFLPMYVYGSLFVVVLEYVDTRRIRRWKARFR